MNLPAPPPPYRVQKVGIFDTLESMSHPIFELRHGSGRPSPLSPVCWRPNNSHLRAPSCGPAICSGTWFPSRTWVRDSEGAMRLPGWTSGERAQASAVQWASTLPRGDWSLGFREWAPIGPPFEVRTGSGVGSLVGSGEHTVAYSKVCTISFERPEASS